MNHEKPEIPEKMHAESRQHCGREPSGFRVYAVRVEQPSSLNFALPDHFPLPGKVRFAGASCDSLPRMKNRPQNSERETGNPGTVATVRPVLAGSARGSRARFGGPPNRRYDFLILPCASGHEQVNKELPVVGRASPRTAPYCASCLSQTPTQLPKSNAI
jgi:hypothetical protein